MRQTNTQDTLQSQWRLRTDLWCLRQRHELNYTLVSFAAVILVYLFSVHCILSLHMTLLLVAARGQLWSCWRITRWAIFPWTMPLNHLPEDPIKWRTLIGFRSEVILAMNSTVITLLGERNSICIWSKHCGWSKRKQMFSKKRTHGVWVQRWNPLYR